MERLYTKYFQISKSTLLLLLSTLLFVSNSNAQEILIGTGTTSTTGATGPPFSLASGYSYSASEQIFTGSEINSSGWISQIGFYKQSGNNDAVDDVSIYLKSTSNTEVGTSVDTSGYVLVYHGSLPNSTTGWVSVPLKRAFQFQHATSNLAVLVVKGAQSGTSNYPAYRRVPTAKSNSASYYRASGTPWTPGSTMTRATSSTNYRAQLRLVFTSCSVTPGITAVTSSGNQAQVDFSCPSCTGNYVIEYGLSGFSPGSEAAAGGGTVTSVSSNSTTLPGLAQGQTYDVYVRNNCSSSNYSVNSEKHTFATSCGIFPLPYTETFNSVAIPALPPCLSIEDLNGGNFWITASYTTNRIYINTAGTAADDWFFTPALYLEANKTYRLQFNYRTGSNTTSAQRFKVSYGNTASSGTSTHLLADYNGVNTNTGTTSQTIYFTPTSGGVQYIGFHAYSVSGVSGSFLALDDIDVRLSDITCLPPVSVAGTPTSDTSVILSWAAPAATIPVQYEWEIRTNTSVGNATGRIATGTTTHPNVSVTVNNLSASTNYNVYVRTNCSGDGNSAWTSVVTFRTPCSAINTPYSEDFSSTTGSNLPSCTSTQGTAWTTALVSSSRALQYLRTYSQYANGYFFSRGVNLDAGKTYRLRFQYRGSATTGTLNFRVHAATWADSSHLIAGSLFEGSATASITYQEGAGTFTPSTSGIYYLGFYAYSSTNPNSQNYLYIDDIIFEEFPECSQPLHQPSSLNLTPTYNTVSGSFTAASGGADQYLVIRTAGTISPDEPQNWIEYTAGTYALGGYIEHAGSGTSFTSNYLEVGTSYTYWVYAYNHASCANGPVYLKTTPLSALVTTLSCSSYTTKTFINTTTNQNINRNWSAITWTPTGAPGPCDNVVITNQNTTNNGYALNITADVPVHIHHLSLVAAYGTSTITKGFDLIVSATTPFIIDGDLTISGTAGSPTNAETEFYSQGGNILVKGNATLGSSGDPVHISFGRNGGNPVFEFRKNVTFEGLSYTRSNGSGTWLFDGTNAQIITNHSGSAYNWPNPGATPAISFQSAVIGSQNAPTVTLAGTKTTYLRGGDLLISNGATLSIPEGQSFNQYTANTGALGIYDGGTLKIGGTADGLSTGNNFPKNYTLNYLEPSSTVEYNGAQTQTLAPLAYGNLTVNNAEDIHVPSGVTVDNTLSFIQGKLITDANVLSLSESAVVTGAGQNRYVEGNLSKAIPESAAQKVFEVGTILNYTPLTLDFYGNVNSGGTIIVKSTEGVHPEIAASGLSEIKYVNTYWNVNATNIHNLDSAGLTFQYHSDDLAGGAEPENLVAAKYAGNEWTLYPASYAGSYRNNTINKDGFGTFILAELPSETCESLTDAVSAASLSLSSVSSVSESCAIDDNFWNYFKDNSGNIIAAVNAHGQDLGAVTLELFINENNEPFAGSKKCSGKDEYYLGRVLKVSSERIPAQSVSLRLFFTGDEYADFKSTLDGQDFEYKDCYGTTVDYSDLTVSAFFAGNEEAVAVADIIKTENGPSGSYQYEFSLQPVYLNQSSNGRFDASGTTLYIHGSGGTGSVLPVELVSFSGQYTAPDIELKWTTASEHNNAGFEILKSTDGISFEKIGEVSGAGNSTTPVSYSLTDVKVAAGLTYFYRLKQVDYDGSTEYSKIIVVETRDHSELTVGNFYPNPAQSITTLPLILVSDVKVSFKLFSPDGRLIQQQVKDFNKGQHLIEIDVRALSTGSYVGQIQIGNENIYKLVSIIR